MKQTIALLALLATTSIFASTYNMKAGSEITVSLDSYEEATFKCEGNSSIQIEGLTKCNVHQTNSYFYIADAANSRLSEFYKDKLQTYRKMAEMKKEGICK